MLVAVEYLKVVVLNLFAFLRSTTDSSVRAYWPAGRHGLWCRRHYAWLALTDIKPCYGKKVTVTQRTTREYLSERCNVGCGAAVICDSL